VAGDFRFPASMMVTASTHKSMPNFLRHLGWGERESSKKRNFSERGMQEEKKCDTGRIRISVAVSVKKK
jgi:hypothetical protein